MYIRDCNQILSSDTNFTKKKEIGGGIHPFHELLYIAAGEVQLQWRGNQYTAAASSLFLLTPNSPHQLDKLSPALSCWFVEVDLQESVNQLDTETVSRWNQLQSSLNWNDYNLEDISQTIFSIQKIVLSGSSKQTPNPYHQILMFDIQKLILLIGHYVNKDEKSILPKNNTPLNNMPLQHQLSDRSSAQQQIFDLIRYLESSYTQEITLGMLSDRSGLTPSYCIKLFRDMTGLTPFQYLQELRLNAAACYLQTTQMTIQQIAESSGFPTIHYFSRMFKQKLGVSPSLWRIRNSV